jgi:hypothetical protein
LNVNPVNDGPAAIRLVTPIQIVGGHLLFLTRNAETAPRICGHVFEMGSLSRCAFLVCPDKLAAFDAAENYARPATSNGECFVDGDGAIIQLAYRSFRHGNLLNDPKFFTSPWKLQSAGLAF